MKKMTKNENNDSFMRDKNIVRAVDGKRKSHCVWPYYQDQYFPFVKAHLSERLRGQGACL